MNRPYTAHSPYSSSPTERIPSHGIDDGKTVEVDRDRYDDYSDFDEYDDYDEPAEVMEAAVVARRDPHWGETPCAFVTLKSDAAPIEAADIIAWCREHLAHFKVPKTVVFGPLPKTATGKIQKYVLRDRARKSES